MPNNIDERIVEMQFDNKQFESGVKDTIKDLDDLKKSLKMDKVADGFEDLNKSVSRVNLNPLQNGVEVISQRFSAMEVIAISALSRITNQAMATAERLVKSFTIDPITSGWSKYESKVAAVQKIVNASADNTIDKVEDVLDEIEWFTNETSYDFNSMVSALGSFSSAGIELEKSKNTIIGLANAAAISGVNAKDFSHASIGFQRAISSGYLSLGIWNSYLKTAGMQSQVFIQACIDSAVKLKVLKQDLNGVAKTAKGTEVTVSSFAETLNEKWVTSDVIADLSERFSTASSALYDMSDNYATVKAAIDANKGSLDDFALRAFQAGQETKTWGDTIEYVRESVGQGWSKTWELIFGNYKEATDFFSELTNETFYDLFVSMGDFRNEMLGVWREAGGAESFRKSLLNIAQTFDGIVNHIRAGVIKLFPILGNKDLMAQGLATAAKVLEQVTGRIAAVFELANPFFEDVEEAIEGVTDKVEEAINTTEEGKQVFEEVSTMVSKIIRGDFGNGAARKTALEELGWSYEGLQNKVNEALNCTFRYRDELGNVIEVSKATADANSEVTESMEEEAETVNTVSQNVLNLASTFKGAVAVIQIIASAISAIIRVGSRIIPYLTKFGEGALGVTGSLGDMLVALRDFIVENDIFYVGLSKIADFIGAKLEPILKWFSEQMESLKNRTTDFNGVIDNIKTKLESLSSSKFFGDIQTWISWATVNTSTFFGNLSKSISGVHTWAKDSGLLARAMGNLNTVTGTAVTTFKNFSKAAFGFGVRAFQEGQNMFEVAKKWYENYGGQIPSIGKAFMNFWTGLIPSGPIGSKAQTLANKVFAAVIPDTSLLSRVKFASGAFRKYGDLFNDLFGELKLASPILASFSNGVNTVTDAFNLIVKLVGQFAKAGFEKLKIFFNPFIEAIRGFVDKIMDIPWERVARFAALAGYFVLMYKALSVLQGASKFLKSIGNLGSQIGGFFKALKVKAYTSVATSVAIAIGIIAGAFYLLSRLDWDEIGKGAAAIGVIGVVLAGSLAALAAIAAADPKSVALGIASAVLVVMAMGGLIAAIYYINKLTRDDLKFGLIRLGIVFVALLGVMWVLKKLNQADAIDIKSMAALYVFVAALGRVIKILNELKDMDANGLVKSITALMFITVAIVGLANGVNNLKFNNTVGFLGMVGALWLFVQVLKGIAKEDFSKLLAGLVKLIPAIIGVYAMAGAAKVAGGGAKGMAAMIISFAISLKMIGEAIEDLGKLNRATLIKGGLAVTGIMFALGAFTYFMSRQAGMLNFFGKGAGSDIGKELLALAAAVYIIAQAMNAISSLGPEKMLVSATSLGLVIIALGAAVGLAADPFKGGAAKIMAFALVIAVLTGSLMLLSIMDMPSILKSAGALGGVLLAVGFALKSLHDIKVTSLIAQVAAIGIVLFMTVKALEELNKLGNPNDLLAKAASLSLIIATVGIVMGALAKLGVPALGLIKVSAALGAAIDVIVLLIGGLATLIGSLGISKQLNEGLDMIVAIFEKLGEAFGKLIGGAIFGFTEKLPEAGENMSKFASNLKEFVTVFSDTKWTTVTSGLLEFSRAINTLSKTNLSTAHFENFANLMAQLGGGLDTFYDVLKIGGVDVNKTKTAAESIEIMVGVLKTDTEFDPTEWQLFNAGINYAAATVVSFYNQIKSDNAFDIGRIKDFSKAIDEIAKIASKTEEIGSFDSFANLVGTSDDNGLDGLSRLAQSIIKFNEEIGMTGNEEGALNVDRVVQTVKAVKDLAKAASMVPEGESSGKAGFGFGFAGIGLNIGREFDKAGFSWDTLSTGLDSLATALVDFSTIALGIDDAGLEKGMSAIDQFVTKSQQLPTSIEGELEKFLFGDNTINGFATGITNLGSSLKSFVESLDGYTVEDLTPAMDMIDKILTIPKKFEESGLTSNDGGVAISLATWGTNLVDFATNFQRAMEILNEVATSSTDEDGNFTIGNMISSLFNDFLGAFNEDILTRLTEAGQMMATYIADGLALDTGHVQECTQIFMGYIMDTLQLQSNLDLFKTRGHDLSREVANAFKDTESYKVAKDAADKFATDMSNVLKSNDNVHKFFVAGENLANGLIAGFLSQKQAAIDAANEMAAILNSGFTGAEDEHSPSRVWFGFGEYLTEGLINGMLSKTDETVDAARYLAGRLNGEFQENSRLSITPVVDINGASSSANRLSNMFDSSRAAALSANMQINSQVSQIDSLVDVTNRILGAVQNGSDLYLDDNILAGRINRRLGVL